MGLRPKPRKFFEKNLTKNFHNESFLRVYIVRLTVILRKRVRTNIILIGIYYKREDDSLPLQ